MKDKNKVYDKNIDIEKNERKLKLLLNRITLKISTGNLIKARALIDQGEQLLKNIQGELPEPLIELYAELLRKKSELYLLNGELHHAIESLKDSLALAQKINNKKLIVMALNNLSLASRDLGDLELAMNYINRCFKIINEVPNNFIDNIHLTGFLETRFDLFYLMGDFEKANTNLQQIEQLYKDNPNQMTEIVFRLSKARILKSSPRARNIVEAEELLKQIVDGPIIFFDLNVMAIINFCDLLTIELINTADMKILDELQYYISKLSTLAEHSKSYTLLVETYLLQAKVSALTLDLKKTKRIFIQAQLIAEKFGLIHLTSKISQNQKEFLEKVNTWKQFKDSKAELSERIKFSRIDEQIKQMQLLRARIPSITTENDVFIHKERKVCLVCRGEVKRFNIYICPECNALYCQNCALALVYIENLCWNCNKPIDPKKPSKIETLSDNLEIEKSKK